jgi:hypothetical protein
MCCAVFGYESSYNDGLVYLNQELASFFCSVLFCSAAAAAAVHNGTYSTFKDMQYDRLRLKGNSWHDISGCGKGI